MRYARVVGADRSPHVRSSNWGASLPSVAKASNKRDVKAEKGNAVSSFLKRFINNLVFTLIFACFASVFFIFVAGIFSLLNPVQNFFVVLASLLVGGSALVAFLDDEHN